MTWPADRSPPEVAVSAGGPVHTRSRSGTRRRTSGEGGLYRRSDGWAASVELPEVDGKRSREVVHAADRVGVQAEVRELQDRLQAAVVHVRATLVRIEGRGNVRGAPKTASSRRSVPLPSMTVAHLGASHAQRQKHLAAGVGWAEDDDVFTSDARHRSTRAT